MTKTTVALVAVIAVALAALVLVASGHGLHAEASWPAPVVEGEDSIMREKEHGTCPRLPPRKLRWSVDSDTAQRINCVNRHFAERAGYFETVQPFLDELGKLKEGETMTFYDIITGRPLFRAPVGRTVAEFVAESRAHGWPSFRDAEVIWDDVRVLKDGETVSTVGAHLGHNLPDNLGNRYCINLVSVAGYPSM